MTLRPAFGPFLLSLIALLLPACDNVSVDKETANAVLRERDTIVSPPDTIVIVRDSIVEIVEHDTTIITEHDTVRIVVRDTVRIDTRGREWEGGLVLFNPSLAGEVLIDSLASYVRIRIDGGLPRSMDLVLLARSAERPKPPPFRTPSWIHLAVTGYSFSPSTVVPLTADPARTTSGNGMGVLFRSEESEQVRWFSTVDRSTGNIKATVDPTLRRIGISASGTFFIADSASPTVKVDSLWAVVRY